MRRTAHIPPPIRALFLLNFRFAGISARLGTSYPFFFLRVFTGLEIAFFAGRPLFLGSVPDFVVLLTLFRVSGIFLVVFGTLSPDFSTDSSDFGT